MSRFISPTDNRLNLRSQEVNVNDIASTSIQELLISMQKTALINGSLNYKKAKLSLVGLSAPQIGKLVRVILVDIDAIPTDPNYSPNMKVFINPRIIKSSKKENLWKESCFSTGNIAGAVYRSNKVTVTAFDENGIEFTYDTTSLFVARILQHEIDHLDGIRFPSRVRSPRHLHIVDKEDRESYKKDWATWTKLCPIEKWLSMYNGEKVEKL